MFCADIGIPPGNSDRGQYGEGIDLARDAYRGRRLDPERVYQRGDKDEGNPRKYVLNSRRNTEFEYQSQLIPDDLKLFRLKSNTNRCV
jgi:nitrate reductase cytochrome c-type subunit